MRGRNQVALTQRDDLGPRRRAGRVQHEADIVGTRLTGTIGGPAHRSGEIECAGRPVRLRLQLDQRDVQTLRDLAHRRIDACLHDHGLRFEVGQVELELVGAVAGIERRGGGGVGDAQERSGHLGAVGQDDRDAVLASEPEAVELLAGLGNLSAEAVEAELRASGRAERGGAAIQRREQFGERFGVGVGVGIVVGIVVGMGVGHGCSSGSRSGENGRSNAPHEVQPIAGMGGRNAQGAAYTDFGEVSEWPKEPISKIGRCGDVPRGFESHPLRQPEYSAIPHVGCWRGSTERCWSGRSGTPGKRVGVQAPRGFESHPLRQL